MGGREEEEVGNGIVGGRKIIYLAVWADKSELEVLLPVCRGMSNAWSMALAVGSNDASNSSTPALSHSEVSLRHVQILPHSCLIWNTT